MRFAVLPVCLLLCIAGQSAMTEDLADGWIGAGLRSATDTDGAAPFARLTLDAPMTEVVGLRGRLDIGEFEFGGSADIELGAGLRFAGDDWSAFADLRYGTTSEGVFAVTGIDLLARSGTLTLGAGPRFSLSSEGHGNGRGDVATADVSTAGPDDNDLGGLLTAGLRLSARYEFGADWGLEGGLQVDRFLDQVELSDGRLPGNAARMSASVMATHRFQLEF